MQIYFSLLLLISASVSYCLSFHNVDLCPEIIMSNVGQCGKGSSNGKPLSKQKIIDLFAPFL